MDTRLPVRDHIFISYRRDDARGASGRLYDWLRIGFGHECVFRDVHSIGVGKWRDKIDAALARSAVCVAVIGPRWADEHNLLRLDRENDMVRHELLTALTSDGLTLVPTLVEGAGVPQAAGLPAELRPLFDTWNARRVTEDGWEDDMRRLIAEIALAAKLPVGPDVETLLRDAGAAQQRIAELEQARHLQANQIEALSGTIDELTRKLAEAPSAERPALADAFAALARGDSRAAENAFEREYEAQGRVTVEARRTMAEAARNVANIALLRDVAKAVAFYRKALELETDRVETARLLGNALVLFGDLQGARSALSQSLKVSINQGDSRGEMQAQTALGDVFLRLGTLEAANRVYSKALELAERRLVADPANTEWQRDLAINHNKIGDVLVVQGDRPGALAAYRKSLDIGEALTEREPGNTQWQRDLSICHIKVGDVLEAQGDRPGALAAYRKSLDIGEALTERDPGNTQWQRSLSISHVRVGNVLEAQGDGPGALAAYRKSLALGEALTERDPGNTQWQRDLSVSYNKIGNVLKAQGDGPGALAAYRRSHAIDEALAARDPANTLWQHDLAISHTKIGDVLMAQGDGPGALAAYGKSIAIDEALAARDPANTEWQRNLSISHERIGNALLAQGKGPASLAAYRKSIAIREALVALDPANTEWQRDLALSHNNIGNVLEAQGDGPGALAANRRSLVIGEALAVRDPANAEWQRDLSFSYNKIGNVLKAQGDGPGALAAYRRSHAILGLLAARDPANAQWQTDLALLCAKLGILEHGQSVVERHRYLHRGRDILIRLKSAGRLMASQDTLVQWFDEQLAKVAEHPP
jgi:tetratricopeptide (TPR) repeat protein